MLFCEDALEQSRLSGTQKTADNCERDFARLFILWFLLVLYENWDLLIIVHGSQEGLVKDRATRGDVIGSFRAAINITCTTRRHARRSLIGIFRNLFAVLSFPSSPPCRSFGGYSNRIIRVSDRVSLGWRCALLACIPCSLYELFLVRLNVVLTAMKLWAIAQERRALLFRLCSIPVS